MTEHEIPGVIPGIFGFFCTSKKNPNMRKNGYNDYMGKYNARFSVHGLGAVSYTHLTLPTKLEV